MRMHKALPAVAATLAAAAGAGALAAAAIVYGGLYDVAATTQHFQPTYTVIETAMRQSVRRRAWGIDEPPLADERTALRGAACFRDHCVQCHGAPGVSQHDIGKSMEPLPGPLVDAARRWRPRELYWVTRNGIRMSGMPSWEYRLTEQELWDVVAFLVRLQDLNAPLYADWIRRSPPAPACGRPTAEASATAADVERGREALRQYACHSCHTIPGVTSSRPQVGPTLKGVGSRKQIAGTMPNTPENLASWLMQTQKLKPGTAMPDMGVVAQDARDIAAYLGTLR